MKLPEFVTADFTRKTIALAMAVIIWVAVRQQLQAKATFQNIPVVFTAAPDLAILDRDDPPRVSITIRGSKSRIPDVTAAQIEVTAHIVAIGNAGHEVLLRSRHIKLPPGIDLVDIQPAIVIARVDRKVTVKRPISYRLEGELPRQYGIDVTIYPQNAEVTGPEQIVEEIEEIVTEPIVLNPGITKRFEGVVKLVVPAEVTVHPADVSVAVELYRQHHSQFFPNLEVLVLMPLGSDLVVAEMEPQLVGALIDGPTSTIDMLTASSIQAYVDISHKERPGTFQLPVHVIVDAKNCEVLEIEPIVIKTLVVQKREAARQNH